MNRPPSLKESGVTLRTPMTTGLVPAPASASIDGDDDVLIEGVGGVVIGGSPQPRRPPSSSAIASDLVVGSRSRPRTAEVIVLAPGLRTPRMDMQRCSASMTTIAPRASRCVIRASAIWVVMRSWT